MRTKKKEGKAKKVMKKRRWKVVRQAQKKTITKTMSSRIIKYQPAFQDQGKETALVLRHEQVVKQSLLPTVDHSKSVNYITS